jgi:hypothetical protein
MNITDPFMIIADPNKTKELKNLAIYLRGYIDAKPKTDSDPIILAAKWIQFLSGKVCAEGYICPAGEKCTSDHK